MIFLDCSLHNETKCFFFFFCILKLLDITSFQYNSSFLARKTLQPINNHIEKLKG